MIKKILFWLENSRLFTVPMSIFSWLVIFTYALNHGGNKFYGVLALIGICLGQLAANLFDDYVDYKALLKKGTLDKQTESKCRYITDGRATLNQVLLVVAIYCLIASSIGFYLFLQTGFPVIIFAVLGGIFVLTYAKWSSWGVGECAVGVVFGPILFGGVYWVMTQNLNTEVFLLSAIVVMFTIGLLYTNAMLDFDGDIASDKNTLCTQFGTKDKAVAGFGIIYGIGYALLIYNVFSGYFPQTYLLPLCTIPLVIDLINSITLYNKDKNSVPPKKFWHIPFENWDEITKQGIGNFRFRMYQARNIQMYFSVLMCISIILGANLY